MLTACNAIITSKSGALSWSDADIHKMHRDALPVVTNLEKMLVTARTFVGGDKKEKK